MRKLVCFVLMFWIFCWVGVPSPAQSKARWRAATPAELEAALPARAPVEKERIETEMRTATGIVDDRHRLIAAIVLITAGYAADGKYSHFFLAQAPVRIGEHTELRPGAYVVGWSRGESGLTVHFFDAASGVDRGAEIAAPSPRPGRVESFRIFPPSEHAYIQIGRFLLPFSPKD